MRFINAIDDADVVLFMVDGKVGPMAWDQSIARDLRKKGKPTVLCVNKLEKDRGEAFPDIVAQNMTIGKSVVRGCVHGGEVIVRDLAPEGGVNQVLVCQASNKTGLLLLHATNIICAHLMAEATRTAVDHDDDLTFTSNPIRFRDFLIEDFVDVLHFDEVVACTDRA